METYLNKIMFSMSTKQAVGTNMLLILTAVFIYLFNLIFFFTLQYCIGFSIHQHASAMDVHVFPS